MFDFSVKNYGKKIIPYLTYFLSASVFLFLFTDCKKSDTPPSGDINVYVAGMLNNKATLWRNGVVQPLRLSSETTLSQALAMTLSGPDVYVVGIQINADHIVTPTYWKNGIPVLLSNGSESIYPYSIAVVGSDVYITGNKMAANGYNVSMYWKNGEKIVLNDSIKCSYQAFAIAVLGTDIYVGGRGFDNDGEIIYWKNGIPVRYSGPDSVGLSEIDTAVTSGADVYLAGSINNNSPVYWKNGTLTYLPQDTSLSGVDFISSIAVSGSDVYALGNGSETAYWKNSTPISLSNVGYNDAVSIAVSGSDVYVAATEQTGNLVRAKYWKNGTPVYLTDGSDNKAEVRAIAVSKQ